MIIQDDIRELNLALEDSGLTLLLLSGAQPSEASSIHEFLERNDALEDWQQFFLITNLNAIGPQQREDWFAGANPDRYAVVRGDVPKQVTCKGPTSDLLGVDAQPSIIEILFVCSKGGNQ